MDLFSQPKPLSQYVFSSSSTHNPSSVVWSPLLPLLPSPSPLLPSPSPLSSSSQLLLSFLGIFGSKVLYVASAQKKLEGKELLRPQALDLFASPCDEANKAINSFRGFILHQKSLFVKSLRGKRKDKHNYSSVCTTFSQFHRTIGYY
ncbi:hypothetical protein Salat_1910600 [Sesamum alatum]|uniref:Uncharacterized protein n=1 Tax=Sesamum alatum TaxID=300844 RepID=A0AAE1Y424_9LAMI|nr:hypothetical protein Salat_1910600 [Sesamum alatum]